MSRRLYYQIINKEQAYPALELRENSVLIYIKISVSIHASVHVDTVVSNHVSILSLCVVSRIFLYYIIIILLLFLFCITFIISIYIIINFINVNQLEISVTIKYYHCRSSA